MRPCNSSVVGDPRSLINDFHSIIFAPSGALPHKGRARRVHRVAQSDPQTANSAGVTLSHRSQPCYGPGGGLWRHQPPGRRGLYPNASLGAPHSRPNNRDDIGSPHVPCQAGRREFLSRHQQT
jgi:hypothetical protein